MTAELLCVLIHMFTGSFVMFLFFTDIITTLDTFLINGMLLVW